MEISLPPFQGAGRRRAQLIIMGLFDWSVNFIVILMSYNSASVKPQAFPTLMAFYAISVILIHAPIFIGGKKLS